MRIYHYYLLLRKAFPHVQDREAFQVTTTILSQVLVCSPRNASIILAKMVRLQWIQFRSGRGRGHTSEVIFLKNKEELLLQEAEDLVMKGEVESAFALMNEFGEGSFVKHEFINWFSHYFGYRVETHSKTTIETLKLPIHRAINTLDPAMAFYAFDSHMVKQIFNTLVEYDYETEQITGGIAHHWTSNEDCTEWTYYLRKGIYFHHGRELEAEDVAFSLNRLKESTHGQNWLVRDIDNIVLLSKYVIQIRLKKPNHVFLLFMSYAPASIVPFDSYKQLIDSDSVLPIGSGPYKVTKRTKGICVLEAFDRYYQGRAFIDRIEIIIVPETKNEFDLQAKNNLLLVRTGETSMQPAKNEWEVVENVRGTSLLTINLKKSSVLQDIQLRKALYHLVNRQQLILDLEDSRLYPSSCLQLPTALNDMVRNNVDNEFDPSLGQDMLKRSQYKGEVIQLFTYHRHSSDANWIKNAYKTYGIEIQVNVLSWRDMLKDENMEQADLILIEAVLSEGMIRQIEYYSSNNSPIKMHLNKQLSNSVNEMIEKLLQSSNMEAQQHQLRMVDQMLREQYAVVPLVYRSVSTISPASLQNVKIHPRGWVDFKNIWYKHE